MKAYSTSINVCIIANNSEEARDILRKQMSKFTDRTMRKTATRGFSKEVDIKNLFNLGLVQQCAAEDCQKYFVPTQRGKPQRYCTMRCRKRIYSRKRRIERKGR